MVFADACGGSTIQLADHDDGWLRPVRLLEDPAPCHRGCRCCPAVTADGQATVVHAADDRPIRLSEETPGAS
ncbi:hypothetical protein ACFOWE_31255 [Planomonospora corallina]|uniref:Uncharacterized protein n=1 Tax=Planomonospora corallina TaxID=1806052 RepID=A0ABV8IGY2_9ACTN